MMEFKTDVDHTKYEIGVLIARMQVHELHDGHKAILNDVCKYHKNVILFLGIPVIPNTKNDPLDFAARKAMVQELYPNIIILPLKDQRSNARWSQHLDEEIKVPFGDRPALLYGSRDSFIPYYEGKYPTAELITDIYYSGTEVRKSVSREILGSRDFRAGVIHANYAQRSVTYPTVDVVAYNEKNQILLAKKPNEDYYRFIGGFVDRADESYDVAAIREFGEETGNGKIKNLKYIASRKINDWRYAKLDSGIMTTLFLGEFDGGPIAPSDDIAYLEWVDIQYLVDKLNDDTLVNIVMPEHFELFTILLKAIQ